MLLLIRCALAATPVESWDFDQDDGGFLAGGELNQWRWGAVGGGPGSGFVGQNAWAIGLDGSYLNDSTEYLELPSLALSGLSLPVLRFAQWYLLGSGDAGFVEVNEGFGWNLIEPTYGYPSSSGYTGTSGEWQVETFPLGTLDADARIRLVFVADLSGVGAGWYVDEVGLWDGDVSAPKVRSLSQLLDTEDLTGPYAVSAVIDDDIAVSSATLWWSIGGETQGSTPMTQALGDTWTGAVPAQAPDTTVSYWVEATDGANATRAPTASALSFRVYLPAPVDLRAPSGRVVGNEAELSWSPPDSVHPVLGYRVERAGVAIADTTDARMTVDLTGSFDIFSVRAIYAEGVGDPTDEVEVDAVVPLITEVDPVEAWPGDTIRLNLWGDYLLMVEGQVALSIGEGASVSAVTVVDVDHLLADVVWSDQATEGPREVTVTSPVGVVVLPAGFTVLPEGGRPALVAAEPSTVEQGDSGQMVLTTQGSIGSPATVDLGADVVVESVIVEEGQVLVEYAVAPNAGLGKRKIVVDDGTRLLEGLTLTVEDYRAPAIRTCSAVEPSGGWLAGVAATAAVLLRRMRRKRAE